MQGDVCAFAEDHLIALKEFSFAKLVAKAWSYQWSCSIDLSRFDSKDIALSWLKFAAESIYRNFYQS